MKIFAVLAYSILPWMMVACGDQRSAPKPAAVEIPKVVLAERGAEDSTADLKKMDFPSACVVLEERLQGSSVQGRFEFKNLHGHTQTIEYSSKVNELVCGQQGAKLLVSKETGHAFDTALEIASLEEKSTLKLLVSSCVDKEFSAMRDEFAKQNMAWNDTVAASVYSSLKTDFCPSYYQSLLKEIVSKIEQ